MATVHKGRDTVLNRPVAVKIPRLPSGSSRKKIVERLYREAQLAAALDHPNICRIYDIGEADAIPYLILAYVEGRTLGDAVLNGGSLGVIEACTIMAKVTRAMAYAHDRKVIHRDLKPENIMLRRDGEPIVMDLGLGRCLDEDYIRLTIEGQVFGTPTYMSPEQARGETDSVGPATDIYSLGVVLYRITTGVTPCRGSFHSLLYQICHCDPRPPTSRRHDLPSALDRICGRAMAKALEDRYPTMDAFADALDRLLAESQPDGSHSTGNETPTTIVDTQSC